ncbi:MULTISPECIES: hypothetical protein [Photobacterium]|uniref:Uncharacterized protein n=1 Tax=Photobacterium ganghwense TaxID=320778 RepID=A0A0J1GV12_9GAMM|nr:MULTISPECIES: hypothetical protein [Photobacterium]KLV03476.1 hypothetical protein ABT57_24585 [Photobacterium ganghwense]MBV1843623.1 hypothetical protein [Photobacterium ganghwense]PSU03152.1 hypothetical protein C9I92_24980 [Photobacterium ganghwense]
MGQSSKRTRQQPSGGKAGKQRPASGQKPATAGSQPARKSGGSSKGKAGRAAPQPASNSLRGNLHRMKQQTKQMKRQPAFRNNRREDLGEIRQTGAAGFVPRISKR